jgi:hypothetical protein
MDVYGEFASQDRKDEKVNIDLSRQLTFFWIKHKNIWHLLTFVV